MSTDDEERGSQAAMRDRNAGERGSRHGARHPRDDVEGHAGGAKREGLFAAAAEDERVAALEPHDLTAPPRRTNHQRVNRALRQRVPARTFADEEALRPPCEPQDALVDERIVQHEVGPAQPRERLACEQGRVAGPRADERNVAGLGFARAGRAGRSGGSGRLTRPT